MATMANGRISPCLSFIINHIALRTAKTPLSFSFGLSECKRVDMEFCNDHKKSADLDLLCFQKAGK